jgi:hypothetical protein
MHQIQLISLFMEGLAHEALRLVKYHRNMTRAAHCERLSRSDVDHVVARRIWCHGIGKATYPTVFITAVWRSCVPVGHGIKM